MTRLIRHIEDLGVDEWATLTRRAAMEAVAAAERRGKTPPAELVAVAAMTERQLVERRARNGPARQRLSPMMQLVEADHLRRIAEGRAREAHQHKLDAEASAEAARAEAEQSARTADAARAELRTVGPGAEARALHRVTERTAATETAEKAVQQLRGEFEQVRADAEAVVAAARERATAAEARAHQRATERTAATEAAENVAQQLRGELKRVRADADAEVAASRGWAAGEAAAVRKAADADVARAYAAADDAIRQAEAKAARAKSLQPLSIPVPSFEFRAKTGHIENALNAIQRIDYVLEVDMAHEGDTDIPLDVQLMQTLAWIVQEHAAYLSNESHSATSGMRQHPREAAAAYEEAATAAFRAMLRRIEIAARRLRGRQRSPDAEVVNIVTGMLADPWVQRAIS